MNVISRPSGENWARGSSSGVRASGLASPDPSSGSNQRSLLVTGSVSRNTSTRPSGETSSGMMLLDDSRTSSSGPEPSARFRYIWYLPSRCAPHSTDVPSGVQTGIRSGPGSNVRRTAPVPSTSSTQTSPMRVRESSLATAMRRPSGESRGEKYVSGGPEVPTLAPPRSSQSERVELGWVTHEHDDAVD